jgi:hypothetical protein
MRGNVKALVDQYADSIVKEILAEHRVHIEDFRTSCRPCMVRLRTTMIKRLYAEGFSAYAISRILKLSERAIHERFNPRIRQRREDRYRAQKLEARA